jgi:hypothetical protein
MSIVCFMLMEVVQTINVMREIEWKIRSVRSMAGRKMGMEVRYLNRVAFIIRRTKRGEATSWA